MGCPLLGSRAGRVSNQGECPRGPFLRVPRPIFQSIRKYCKNNLHKGKAPVGRGREEPQDEPFLMSPCLTDLQGVDNPTDILFWNLPSKKQREKFKKEVTPGLCSLPALSLPGPKEYSPTRGQT